jgi:hypothetical protein
MWLKLSDLSWHGVGQLHSCRTQIISSGNWNAVMKYSQCAFAKKEIGTQPSSLGNQDTIIGIEKQLFSSSSPKVHKSLSAVQEKHLKKSE